MRHSCFLDFRRRVARVTGLEPATSGVTGRHSNQLSYTRVSQPRRLVRRGEVGRLLRPYVQVKRPERRKCIFSKIVRKNPTLGASEGGRKLPTYRSVEAAKLKFRFIRYSEHNPRSGVTNCAVFVA